VSANLPAVIEQRLPRLPDWKALVIELRHFEFIKQKHGGYASWAVWADAAENPKSNMGDMSIFDLDSNPRLLEMLKTNIIMVGLNISSFSRLLPEPFRNFHDPNPRANDFKIRYAFQNTQYYGAYMTDIIKRVGMINSKDLLGHLKVHPALVEQNVENFREELRDLNCTAPTILTFGAGAYNIVHDNLRTGEYSRLIKLTHYSHYISKEKYREKVLSQIQPRDQRLA
jgi:hypothetical protein